MPQAMEQSTPPPMPIQIADIGPTNPEPGVIATNPATAPLAAPKTVGFPLKIQSIAIQERAAAAVARWVATKADVAKPSAASALPALKPNQPTHNSPAPITLNGRLCGGIASWPYPMRGPNIIAATRAEAPELMWTTVPPAKSRAPISFIHPLTPHTQWASGS